MANEIKNEDLDFDNMSAEQLEKFINSGGENVTETKQPSEEIKEEEKSEEQPTEETSVEADPVETNEETTEQPVKEEQPAEPEVDPRFRGKGVNDFIDMQRNADKKISQLGQEKYHLQEKVKELETLRTQKEEQVSNTQREDRFKDYAKEDIEMSREIAREEFSRLQAENQNKIKQTQEEIAKHHDALWDNLKRFNPDHFNKIEGELVSSMKADMNNTYFKKGWLMETINNSFSSNNGNGDKPAVRDENVIKRKVKASTVSGQGSAPSGLKKDLGSMSPSEFADDFKRTSGFSIFEPGFQPKN